MVKFDKEWQELGKPFNGYPLQKYSYDRAANTWGGGGSIGKSFHKML